MGAVLALSAWLGLEALQGGPSIAGRVLERRRATRSPAP